VVRVSAALAVVVQCRVQSGVGVGDLADGEVAATRQGVFDLADDRQCRVVTVAGVTEVAENLHQQHRDRPGEIERCPCPVEERAGVVQVAWI
jgi:hypothetical protein